MESEDSCSHEGVSLKVEFLYQSYSNTQEVIQFFDTKAGAYVAVNGILATLLMNRAVHTLTELSSKTNPVPKYIFLVLLGGIAVGFLYQLARVLYQAFLVLLPRHGPDLVEKGNTVGLFWAGDIIEYLQNHTLDQYTTAIHEMSGDDLVAELTYESVKLSHITCIKLEHLEKATKHFKWTILSWVVLLFIASLLETLLPHLQ